MAQEDTLSSATVLPAFAGRRWKSMEELSFSSCCRQWGPASNLCTPLVVSSARRVNLPSDTCAAEGGPGEIRPSITNKPSTAETAPKPFLLPSLVGMNENVYSGVCKLNGSIVVPMPSTPPPPPPPPPPRRSIATIHFHCKPNRPKSSMDTYHHQVSEHFLTNKVRPSVQVPATNSTIDYGSIAAAAAAAARKRQQATAPPLPPLNNQSPDARSPQPPLSLKKATDHTPQPPLTPPSSLQQSAILEVKVSNPQSSPLASSHQEAPVLKIKISKPTSQTPSSKLAMPLIQNSTEDGHHKESLVLAWKADHLNELTQSSCSFMRKEEQLPNKMQNMSLSPHRVACSRKQRHREKGEDVSMKSCGLFCISRMRRPVVTSLSPSLAQANFKMMPYQPAKALREHLLAKRDGKEAFVNEVKAKLQQRRKLTELRSKATSANLRLTTVANGSLLRGASGKVAPKMSSCGNALKTTFVNSGTLHDEEHVANISSDDKQHCITADDSVDDREVIKLSPIRDCAGSFSMKTASLMREVMVASLDESSLGMALFQDEIKCGQTQHGHEEMVVCDDELQFYDAFCKFEHWKCMSGYSTEDPFMSPCGSGCPTDWTNDGADFIDAPSHFNSPSASVSDQESIDHYETYTKDGSELDSINDFKCFDSNADKGDELDMERFTEAADTFISELKCMESKIVHTTDDLDLDTMSGKSCGANTGQLCDHVSKITMVCTEGRQVDAQEMIKITKQKSSDGSLQPNAMTSISPARCQKIRSFHDFGWPFGVSKHQSYKTSKGQQSFSGLPPNLTSLPLPPSPSGLWLKKAIRLNASKMSPLAVLQRNKAVTVTPTAKVKLNFSSSNAMDEGKLEDVVRSSHVQPGHWTFSEEFKHHHPDNLNAMKPLRL